MVTRLCTWAGKLLKLVSLPMKPWINTSIRRRRPVFCCAGSGTSDCVEEERGSCEDMPMTEYGGGASLVDESRGGRGGGRRWCLGGSEAA
jgi:hypothetical protein